MSILAFVCFLGLQARSGENFQSIWQILEILHTLLRGKTDNDNGRALEEQASTGRF